MRIWMVETASTVVDNMFTEQQIMDRSRTDAFTKEFRERFEEEIKRVLRQVEIPFET